MKALLHFLIFLHIPICCASSPEKELTSKPQKIILHRSLPSLKSWVSIPISTKVNHLETLVNKAIPDLLHTIDQNQRIVEESLGGIPISVSVHLSGWVKRNGPIELTSLTDGLNLQIPLKVKVTASKFGVDIETAHAALTVTSKLGMNISRHWMPIVKASSSFRWDTPPYIEIIGIRITFASEVNGTIREQLGQLEGELQKVADKNLQLRQEAEKVWNQIQEPQLLSEDAQVWLVSHPLAVWCSPLLGGKDHIMFRAGIEVKTATHFGRKPVSSGGGPLPALIPKAPDFEGFNLQMPILVSYLALQEESGKSLLGKSFEIEYKGLTGHAVIEKLKIYPSGDKVVVEAQVKVNVPGILFNVAGTIFLMGKPVFDQNTKTLSVANLDFTAQVDNLAARMAIWLLNDKIRRKLQENLNYDASSDYNRGITQANSYFNGQEFDSFRIQGKLDEVTIEDIHIRERDLLILVTARGNIAVQVQKIAN